MFLVSVGAIGDANGLGLALVVLPLRIECVRCMHLVFTWALNIESSTREKASGKTLARHGLLYHTRGELCKWPWQGGTDNGWGGKERGWQERRKMRERETDRERARERHTRTDAKLHA